MFEFWPQAGVPPLQRCTTKPPLQAIKQMPACIPTVSVGRLVFVMHDSLSVRWEIMIRTSKVYD